MSTRDHHPGDQDDLQLDAFLRGEDELSRSLRELPQPEPSAELSAAILADAAAALTGDKMRERAANDDLAPQAPAVRPAPHFLRRIALSFGIAASVAFALTTALRHWQDVSPDTIEAAGTTVAQKAEERVALLEEKPEPQPAPKIVMPPPPPVARAAPPVTKTPAAPPPDLPPPPVVQFAAPPPQPTIAAVTSVKPADAATVETRAADMAKSEVPAPTMVPTPAPVAAAPAATTPVTITGSRIALAPTAGQAAAIKPQSVPDDNPDERNANAESWLALIDEMLKAGLKRDAREEWQKFRKSYPSYPVADKLRKEFEPPAPEDAPADAGTERR